MVELTITYVFTSIVIFAVTRKLSVSLTWPIVMFNTVVDFIVKVADGIRK